MIEDQEGRGVRITGVNIPFWDWVMIWFTASLAAIPAAIALAVVGLFLAWGLAACGVALWGI